MARIDWVKARLDNWARWVAQRESGGTGYPRQSAFSRLAHASVSADTCVIPVNDIDASNTDKVIRTLRFERSALWLVLQCHYVGNPEEKPSRRRPMSTDEIADRMSITRRGVQARLEQADCALAVLLDRREAR